MQTTRTQSNLLLLLALTAVSLAPRRILAQQAPALSSSAAAAPETTISGSLALYPDLSEEPGVAPPPQASSSSLTMEAGSPSFPGELNDLDLPYMPDRSSMPGLPNEPGWTLPVPPPLPPPCPVPVSMRFPAGLFSRSAPPAPTLQPCIRINPYKRFLDTTAPVPLTPRQKAHLAVHNYLDPGNLVTIVGTAAFTVGTDSHTAYGPGWKGFGLNTAYSFSQDATGEFFGTFLVPSLFHEDPHYHREPNAPIAQRIVHAVSRTLIAQHDDGSLMPNYAALLAYPISAEISNLYVPGIHGNGPSTVERVLTGLATDPVNNLITEFLPDVAKHVNIRVVFVQRVLNMVTAGASTGAVAQ